MIHLTAQRTKKDIVAQEFAGLRGQPISLSDAGRKYGTSYKNFGNWAKLGYIKIISNDGYRTLIDEAEAAYCAKIYHEKYREHGGNMKGVIIFDEHGNPYQMKYPDLAERKRLQRRRKKPD